jgi:hypothetical protein
MTVLSAVQGACAEGLSLAVPDAVYSSTRREHVELGALANAAAEYIAREHDWQALKDQATITGDGTTTDFALPSDYDRMTLRAGLWSAQRLAPLSHIYDSDEWLGLQTLGEMTTYGSWTMYGGRIHIMPAPAASEVIKYFYMKNTWARSAGGAAQTGFLTDTDTFVLSETLLKLALIWMHKQSKGRPYAEDMETYEREKERITARDKGSRVIRIGDVRTPAGVKMAYPRALG